MFSLWCVQRRNTSGNIYFHARAESSLKKFHLLPSLASSGELNTTTFREENYVNLINRSSAGCIERTELRRLLRKLLPAIPQGAKLSLVGRRIPFAGARDAVGAATTGTVCTGRDQTRELDPVYNSIFI